MATNGRPRYPHWSGSERMDPYPLYEILRASDPVHWSVDWNAWVLTRHADVVAAMHDVRFSRDVFADSGDTRTFYGGLFPYRDPPAHGRLRTAARRSDLGSTEEFATRVTRMAENCLDTIDLEGGVDVMSQFARPVTQAALTVAFGLHDREAQALWSYPLGPAADRQFFKVVQQIVADRRRLPSSDPISRLSGLAGELALTDDEVLGTAFVLLRAGFETTANSLANAVAVLWSLPNEVATVAADPTLLRDGVDELLRIEPTVHEEQYMAADDITLEGRTIRKGQRVLVSLGSANRDSAQFPDPDSLQLTRSNARSHVSFGGGLHFCLGAHLARVVVQMSLHALVAEGPALRLAAPPVWAAAGHRHPARLVLQRFPSE